MSVICMFTIIMQKRIFTASYEWLCQYMSETLPHLPVMRMEGTYLAWVDCSAIDETSEEIEERLLCEHKVWVNAGSMYGSEGEHFIRINMACPRERLEEGVKRIVEGLADWNKD